MSEIMIKKSFFLESEKGLHLLFEILVKKLSWSSWQEREKNLVREKKGRFYYQVKIQNIG